MATDVLLIVPPSPNKRYVVRDKYSMYFSKGGFVYPPFDFMWILANLKKNNVNARIIDGNVNKLSFKEIYNIIKEEEPDWLAFSSATPTIDFDLNIPKIAKSINKNIKTLTFGPHAGTLPEQTFSSCKDLDYIVINEQESVIANLVCSAGKDTIGTWTRNGDEFTDNGLYPWLESFSIPYPAHDDIDLNKYRLPNSKSHPSTITMTSRGCNGSCQFCNSFMLPKKILFRSIENIMEEMYFLKDVCGVKEIKFWDDNITFDRDRLIKFCESLIKSNLNFSWSCSSRVDQVDSELLKIMKIAGCHTINFGVESGDDKVLESISKGTNTEIIKQAFNIADKAGIKAMGYFMLGHPTDTMETMKKTLDLAISLKTDMVSFNIAVPFPGTPLFEIASKNKWIREKDWSKFETTQFPVYEPPNLSREQIWEFYKLCYKKYYFNMNYIMKRFMSIRSFHDFKRDFKSLISLIKMIRV